MSSDQPDTIEASEEELARFREEWRKEVEAKREWDREGNKEGQGLSNGLGKGNGQNKEGEVEREREKGKGKLQPPYGIGERARKALERSPERIKKLETIGSPVLKSFSDLSLSPPKHHSSPHHPTPAHINETSMPSSSSSKATASRKVTRSAAAAAAREGIATTEIGSRAVDFYAKAVEFEQGGQLNEALHMYRKAYKLDGSVEKSYRKKELEFEREAMASALTLTVTDPSIPIELEEEKDFVEAYTFRDHKQFHPDYVSPHTISPAPSMSQLKVDGKEDKASSQEQEEDFQIPIATDPLSLLISTWPPTSDLAFEPEEENYPLHLSLLPDELFHPIFSHMDVQTLERFGSTCKKLRVLTRGAGNWKELVDKLYRPPVVPEALVEEDGKQGDATVEMGEKEKETKELETPSDSSLTTTGQHTPAEVISPPSPNPDDDIPPVEIDPHVLELATLAYSRARQKQLLSLARKHALDWRSTFVEEKRVRYDGVYISVCHYVRPGQSDLAWVNITHLITYHRFLRFYPDGTAISFLTTDHPVDVVHIMKPSLRAKGLLFGTWSIGTVKDEKGIEQPRIEIRSMLEPGITPKYEFEMDLSLKCTTRGRWNKLEMQSYQSINLASGEALGLSLKHQKAFFFSKVRSYPETL